MRQNEGQVVNEDRRSFGGAIAFVGSVVSSDKSPLLQATQDVVSQHHRAFSTSVMANKGVKGVRGFVMLMLAALTLESAAQPVRRPTFPLPMNDAEFFGPFRSWLDVKRVFGAKGVTMGMELPEHPRLLFNRAGIAELSERLQRHEWAKAKAPWEALKRRADERLRETVELPPRGGNWWHYYACPEHGASLRTGKQIGKWQWEHICPVDNKVFVSDPTRPERDYDGCVLMSIHQRLANAVRDLGIVYQVTGEQRYAEKAKEILLAYANHYLSYPLHTIRGEAKIGGGRVGPQTLDEAVWLIPIAQGADLIWEALTDEERQRVAQKLFLPAVRKVLLPHRMGVHNIQCWKNSAVGLVGFLLGDGQLT